MTRQRQARRRRGAACSGTRDALGALGRRRPWPSRSPPPSARSARPRRRSRRPCPASILSTRPRMTTMLSSSSAPSAAVSAFSKTRTSIWPSRSSIVANIIVEPARVRIFFAAATMPPIFTQSPSLRSPTLRAAAVDLRPQRLPHRLERMLGDEQADGLLLQREDRLAVVLVDRDRRVRRARRSRRPRRRRRRRRRRSRPGRRSRPARSARPAGPLRRRPAPPRAPRACPCGSRRWSRSRRT